MAEENDDLGAIDFTDAGFYSDETLTPKRVKVGDHEGLVYVRKLPVIDLRRFQMETTHPDQKVRETAGLMALVKGIRREDGKPHLTFEQAKKLKGLAVAELMRVFVEVNADGAPDPEEAGND